MLWGPTPLCPQEAPEGDISHYKENSSLEIENANLLETLGVDNAQSGASKVWMLNCGVWQLVHIRKRALVLDSIDMESC